MRFEPSYLFTAGAVGLGATLVLDLWNLFLKRTLNIALPNYCLVGRWFRYMPEGIFRHRSIAAAPGKTSECTVGWIAHYGVGAVLALALAALAPSTWLRQPTLLPALLFGVATVAIPFLVMQPCFGVGVASSRSPKPTQARLRSLMTHTVFGFGLFVSAITLSSLLGSNQ
jgi:hypothetical protein